MPADSDVIIIGAGASGLSAARELGRLGLTYTVIEGSHRIGGRAYSEEIAPGVWFDLGCAWLVGGATNPFVAIADELGIMLDKNNSDKYKTENHRFQRNDKPLDEDQRAACLGFYSDSYDKISAVVKQGQDVAVSDVIDLDNEFAAPFLCDVAAAWGNDVDLVSTADFANSTGELGFQAQHGYGNLVAEWGANVAVSLNTRALRIDWSGHGVTVETPKGTIAGRIALCTVSTGILASGEILFTPGLPDWKIQAINNLPMGTENKIGVYFDADVFGADGRGYYSIWNDDGNAAKVDASVMGLNTAAVIVGGRHGVWLEKQGQQACHDFAVDRIAELFGHDIRKHVKRTIATAWNTEPWTLGSWACALPGQAYQRANLQRPVDERLYFAGEATVYGRQGTCDGAYQSGIRAANEIARQLNAKQ
ncbi:MAG: FAD-dependent oxidoreductase [Gammaproteobacteria bacterium]|nr:FAD-dependent oxidoreductase [Gammaproteobacteria bacterium]